MENHVILTLGRSGSNTLVDILNQHPNLLNFGEVLGDWNVVRRMQRKSGFWKGNDRGYLDALLDNRLVHRMLNTGRSINKLRNSKRCEIKRLSHVKSVGFKEFALNFDKMGLRDYLTTRPDIKLIGLERTEVVDRLVSAQLLRDTGVVLHKDGANQAPKLELDPSTLVDDLGVIASENGLLNDMLSELPQDRVFRIDYADLYASPERTKEIAEGVFDFLGVDQVPVRTRMTKIVKGGPQSAILNLDECRDVVRKTRFDGIFETAMNEQKAP